MQAVLLVAGKSSRMYPYGSKHKSTLSLLGKPIIIHTLEGLIMQGVDDLVIVESSGNGVREAVEKADLSVKTTFVEHVGARGMGEALLDAKEHLAEQFLVVNAHHVDAKEVLPDFLAALGDDPAVLVQETADATEFGGVRIENDRVVSIEEKPVDSKTYGFRIVGYYFLTRAFVDLLGKVEKEHYSFEGALSTFSKTNTVQAVTTEKEVVTCKYPFHLFDISHYLLDRAKKRIDPSATIHPSATLQGEVIVGKNVQIMENAVIKGPCFLGDNVRVGNNAVIRDHVVVEEDVTIGANLEVKNSILFRGVTTHTGYIGDSIVGSDSKIAAQFVTGNVRLDRQEVSVLMREKTIASGRKHLGVFIGSNTRVGINVSTMPGVIIGNGSVIGPQTIVMKNVPDETSYYSKFDEVIEKKKSSVASSKDVVLFDIDYTLFDTDTFKASSLTEFKLYEEVVAVLHQLGKDVTLGIFSEGELDFQKTKLVNTMIDAHFSENDTHIVTDKHASLQSVVTKYSAMQLTLIDDKLEVLEKAKSIADTVFTIWVKRGPYATSTTSTYLPDATVQRLDEVIEVIKKRK